MSGDTIPVAGYARVSTHDQEQYGFSLETQVDNIIGFVGKHTGYQLVCDVFSEDFTGTTLDRPKLDELMAMARNGLIKKLIVYEMDRLARREALQVILEEELRKLKVEIEYVLYDFPDTPHGRFQRSLYRALAELEREIILERTIRGQKKRAEKYVIPSGTDPYGYKYYRPNRDHKGEYVIVEEEAAIVAKIFDWYVNEKVGGMIIAGRLTAMAIPTRYDQTNHSHKKRHNGVWSEKSILNILKNKTYTGIYYWGKTKIDPDTKKRVKNHNQDEWYSVPVPKIVDYEIWAAAQEQIKANKKDSRRNTKYNYLMRQRLVCETCGFFFGSRLTTGRNNNSHNYYICGGTLTSQARNGKEKTCRGVLRAEKIDNAVWNEVKTMLENPERIVRFMRQTQETANVEAEIIRNRLVVIEDAIIERKKIQDDLVKSLAKIGKSQRTIDLIEQEITKNDKLLDDLEIEAKPLRVQLAKKEHAADERKIDRMLAWCKDVKRGLEIATFEDKLTIIKELDIRGIVHHKENGGIQIAFSGILPTIDIDDIDRQRPNRVSVNSSLPFTFLVELTN